MWLIRVMLTSLILVIIAKAHPPAILFDVDAGSHFGRLPGGVATWFPRVHRDWSAISPIAIHGFQVLGRHRSDIVAAISVEARGVNPQVMSDGGEKSTARFERRSGQPHGRKSTRR